MFSSKLKSETTRKDGFSDEVINKCLFLSSGDDPSAGEEFLWY